MIRVLVQFLHMVLGLCHELNYLKLLLDILFYLVEAKALQVDGLSNFLYQIALVFPFLRNVLIHYCFVFAYD